MSTGVYEEHTLIYSIIDAEYEEILEAAKAKKTRKAQLMKKWIDDNWKSISSAMAEQMYEMAGDTWDSMTESEKEDYAYNDEDSKNPAAAPAAPAAEEDSKKPAAAAAASDSSSEDTDEETETCPQCCKVVLTSKLHKCYNCGYYGCSVNCDGRAIGFCGVCDDEDNARTYYRATVDKIEKLSVDEPAVEKSIKRLVECMKTWLDKVENGEDNIKSYSDNSVLSEV